MQSLTAPSPALPVAPAIPLSLARELAAPYPISRQTRQRFQEDGFIKLKEVLSADALSYFEALITAEVKRLNTNTKPLAERDTYQRAFLQVMNLWRESPEVRALVFSARLARLAADLMGVDGVRLYHDQALYKEAGGGHTPWHADQFYWPLDTANTVTAWIPLQATPLPMGPLAFSAASHRLTEGRDLAISDRSEAAIAEQLARNGLDCHETPFDLGEVSFHYGWTFHRAGANRSDAARAVMTIIYFEDGARVAAPANANQAGDLAHWMPDLVPGDLAASQLNPRLYPV